MRVRASVSSTSWGMNSMAVGMRSDLVEGSLNRPILFLCLQSCRLACNISLSASSCSVVVIESCDVDVFF